MSEKISLDSSDSVIRFSCLFIVIEDSKSEIYVLK